MAFVLLSAAFIVTAVTMIQDAAPDPALVQIVRDPLWFAQRYDPGHDAFHFQRLDRDMHRAATFLTDEYLPKLPDPLVIGRQDAIAAQPPQAPMHFIFHSAFCCSTVLARAFDLPGAAMGLKEPVLLNDLVGWSHRGGTPREVAAVLDHGLALLARPFADGETVVVKPSNITNGFAPAILTMRPMARALLLYAPIDVYLGSIAKKGMEGQIWVRDLLVKQIRDGLQGFGYKTEDYLAMTDLQVAAIGWLAQHALFSRMIKQFGPERVRTIDSETMMANPEAAMTALAQLFGVPMDAAAVVAGPAFTRHSKFGLEFGAAARTDEIRASADAHAEDIAKISYWATKVAENAELSLVLPAGLLA